jgi:hypothetical protein
MRLTLATTMVLLAAVPCIASCDGADEGPRKPAEPAVVPAGPSGLWCGQEIWLTYASPEHRQFGAVRIERPSAEAKALAEQLRNAVLAGADVGALARRHSNAPGGIADGFCLLPNDPAKLDARDRALMTVNVGEVTPLVDWLGGWWFARRVSEDKGRALKARFEELARTEVRGLAIVLHYDKVYPYRRDQKRTREQARETAAIVLARALAGEHFGALAREFSSDEWGMQNGGELRGFDPGTKTFSAWLRCADPYHPNGLLEVLMDGPLGVVHPEILDTGWGFVIAKPLERRKAAP